MQYLAQQITSFLDTNLTDTYSDWSSSTTYSFESGTPTNASVARYETYYYRSVVNSNLNNNPVTTENIKWTKYGVSNKFAMLDLASNTKSVYNSGNLYVTFLQNQINTLTIGNYEAETITVQILTESNSVVWEYTTDSSTNDLVEDYWTYIYTDYGYEVDRAVKINLPISDYKIKVIFNKSTEASRTACGYLVAGEAIDMGTTLSSINFKFNSFALKTTDDWGTLTITKRAVQDLVDFETIIDSDRLQTYKRQLKTIYNDIVVFIVDESESSNYENILTLGVIQDASIVLTDLDKTIISYSIIESI